MFQTIINKMDDFDSCADWVSPGESFGFAEAPSIIVCPFKWDVDGSVSFDVFREISEGVHEKINRFTFRIFPGMAALAAIAKAHAEPIS